MKKFMIIWLCASAVTACGKKSAPPQATVAAKPTVEAPAALPVAASATALPLAVSPAEAATSTVDEAAHFSIMLTMLDGAHREIPQPLSGIPTYIRLTPLNGKGQAIAALDPVMDAEIVMIAVSADLGWCEVQRAVKRNDPTHLRHEFKVTFPKPGSHVVYALFAPRGKPIVKMPIFLRVPGDAPPGVELTEDQLRHTADGLSVALIVVPAPPQTDAKIRVTSHWTRKDKRIQMFTQTTTGQGVWYVAIDTGLAEIEVAAVPRKNADLAAQYGNSPVDEGLLEDAGAAEFTLPHKGRYRILAVAQENAKAAPVTMPLALYVRDPPIGGDVPKAQQE